MRVFSSSSVRALLLCSAAVCAWSGGLVVRLRLVDWWARGSVLLAVLHVVGVPGQLAELVRAAVCSGLYPLPTGDRA